MRKRIVTIVLLCLVIGAAIVGGVYFYGRYSARKQDCEERLTAAQEALSAAEAERDSVDRDAPQGAEAWQTVVDRLMGEGEEAAAALEEEVSALEESVREADKALKKAQSGEDYEYYRAIYDVEAEGVERVEGYIEKGN